MGRPAACPFAFIAICNGLCYTFAVSGKVDVLPDVVAIVGPTATGKTAASIALANSIAGRRAEIVSLDSMQIYRYLDIGTAKPTHQERAAAKFCGIDLVDPDYNYTLAEYQAYAAEQIARIRAAGRVAILSGGTGLYFRAVTTRLDIPVTPPDEAFRARWQAFAAENGNERLHAELDRVDPAAAARIHTNDLRRTIRALEVYEKTGKRMSEWHRENRIAGEADKGGSRAFLCLTLQRESLAVRINDRVDRMMADGLVEEVERVRSMGYGSELRSMQSLGYRQINQYLEGAVSLEDAVASIKLETRQFARRQLIWFRADKRLRWIEADGKSTEEIVHEVINTSIIK